MFIDNRRWTVQELIEKLAGLPPHHEVRLSVSYDGGVSAAEAPEFEFEFDISPSDTIIYLTDEAMQP